MKLITIDRVGDDDGVGVGGKAVALARLRRAGLRIPPTVCLPTTEYRKFVESSDLESVVAIELGRKPFEDMRWEELWDAALRIRNRFVRTPFPNGAAEDLEQKVRAVFGDVSLVVRSSAPGEDSASASFAGLHDSVVGVSPHEIADAVRQVWASLWSDRALLYRQELNLSFNTSAMAVVVQALVPGEASGVAFSVDPTNPNQSVIEAVHGLNQGLVDGTVSPDRWLLDRDNSSILDHQAPDERLQMQQGLSSLETVAGPRTDAPPLDPEGVMQVRQMLTQVEEIFDGPQDVEWTIAEGYITVLQARPITTDRSDGDQRAWYLSLTRSLENLKQLRQRVETEWLPDMDAEAAELASSKLSDLDDSRLADEISTRVQTYDRWVDIYWKEFIPLAHGVRLFGQFYNDAVQPTDPFEFIDLLAATPMLSLQRNRALEALADEVRRNPALASEPHHDEVFEARLAAFIEQFGSTTVAEKRVLGERKQLIRVVSALAKRPPAAEVARPSVEGFLEAVAEDRRQTAEELLNLARSSYRLRDDDNIHLAAVKAEVLRATGEAKRRLGPAGNDLDTEQLVSSLRHPNMVVEPKAEPKAPPETPGFSVRARQLVGQPAGPGVAVGAARIVDDPDQLFEFQAGEILVCDAVEPNMTFVVPLAAAIVERRGGMLIHGAIIAREYGLPCVTGVAHLADQIATGDRITVDGFLGIVTVG